MADRCVAMSDDGVLAYYLWDSGWLTVYNAQTDTWSKQRLPHPSEIADAPAEPNRELAPEVSDD